jgi:hypothetical protein
MPRTRAESRRIVLTWSFGVHDPTRKSRDVRFRAAARGIADANAHSAVGQLTLLAKKEATARPPLPF